MGSIFSLFCNDSKRITQLEEDNRILEFTLETYKNQIEFLKKTIGEIEDYNLKLLDIIRDDQARLKKFASIVRRIKPNKEKSQ